MNTHHTSLTLALLTTGFGALTISGKNKPVISSRFWDDYNLNNCHWIRYVTYYKVVPYGLFIIQVASVSMIAFSDIY